MLVRRRVHAAVEVAWHLWGRWERLVRHDAAVWERQDTDWSTSRTGQRDVQCRRGTDPAEQWQPLYSSWCWSDLARPPATRPALNTHPPHSRPCWNSFRLKLIKQEAQLMLTNPRNAFRGQSRSSNIVPFHMLGKLSCCAIVTFL